MDEYIDKINKGLSKWERIQAYKFINHHLSVAASEITPSLKLKREVLMKKFSFEIDQLYKKEREG